MVSVEGVIGLYSLNVFVVKKPFHSAYLGCDSSRTAILGFSRSFPNKRLKKVLTPLPNLLAAPLICIPICIRNGIRTPAEVNSWAIEPVGWAAAGDGLTEGLDSSVPFNIKGYTVGRNLLKLLKNDRENDLKWKGSKYHYLYNDEVQ